MRGLLLKIFICLLFAGGAQAHDKKSKFNINDAVRGGEFVVLAKVTDISYAISKGDNSAEMLPHTFVTYQILKVIKGNPRQGNDKFTLRFLGGRGEQSSFLHPSNYPLFDIGDEDVLFIKGNTKAACPLYNCATGRFRAIQGAMYNEKGQQVVRTRGNAVDFGKFHSLPDIMTHKVSQTTLFLKEGPSDSEGKPEPDLPIGNQFTRDAFVSFVEGKIKRAFPPDVLDKWPKIPSADPRMPFVVKPVRELRGRARTDVPYKPIVPPSESDRFEESEFGKNQGNPVIKK